MKRIIILFSILLIFNSCSDDNPVNGNYFKEISYSVTGPQTNVLVTISGAEDVTQYNHIALPFKLYPFKKKTGEFIGLNVLDWDNTDSLMTVKIFVDGIEYKTTTGSGLVELYGNAN